MGTLSTIREVLTWYKDFKYMFNESKSFKETYQRLSSISVNDKEELISGLIDGKIKYNDFVKMEGILVDYAHLHTPITYINSIPYIPNYMKKNKNMLLGHDWEAFQLPISRIPDHLFQNDELRLSFLYPTTFNSFIYDAKKGLIMKIEENGSRNIDPHFNVPKHAKPIPVIVSKDDAIKYRFKRVKITAEVSTLKEQIASNLIQNKFSSLIFSDLVRPLSPNTPSICLDITKNKSQISSSNSGNKYLRNCTSSLYIECHVKGLNNNYSFKELVESCYPKPIQGTWVTGDIYTPITYDKIRVIAREPNFIGFYRESDIAQEIYFEKELRQLATTVYGFEKNLIKLDNSLSLHIDFMFDYRLKNKFKTELLNDENIRNIANEEIEMKKTIEWLKGSYL